MPKITRKGQTFDIDANGFPLENGKIASGKAGKFHSAWRVACKTGPVDPAFYANKAQQEHARKLMYPAKSRA